MILLLSQSIASLAENVCSRFQLSADRKTSAQNQQCSAHSHTENRLIRRPNDAICSFTSQYFRPTTLP